MKISDFLSIIEITTPSAPEDIDDLLAASAATGNLGIDVFPRGVIPVCFPTAFRDPQQVNIGFRISDPRSDLPSLSVQLASLGIEQSVGIIVLSYLDYCGLERFGFRTERVTRDAHASSTACEEQISKFWALEVII